MIILSNNNQVIKLAREYSCWFCTPDTVHPTQYKLNFSHIFSQMWMTHERNKILPFRNEQEALFSYSSACIGYIAHRIM